MSALPGMTAEEYAAGLIRRALDSAVVPDLPLIADESALTLREVEAIRDRILSGKRGTKDLGRPRAAAPIPPRVAAVPPTGPAELEEDLIAAGLALESPAVRRAAKRAHDARVKASLAMDGLRAAIDDFAAEAAERERKAKRIAKLEAELAELRGTPKRGGVSPVREAYYPPTACESCGKTFTGVQGVNLHRRTGCGA